MLTHTTSSVKHAKTFSQHNRTGHALHCIAAIRRARPERGCAALFTSYEIMLAATLLVALCVASVAAQTSNGALHRALHRRQSPHDAAAYAKIDDETQACKYYDVPEFTPMLHGHGFPEVSQPATILPNDKRAQRVWAEIQQSGIIPQSIKVKKGVPDHSATAPGVADSYDKSDPDCWWTFNKCMQPKHSSIPEDIHDCPQKDTWGLSFDDGPNCTHNPFYDFLQQKKLRATMFYIGTNVVTWPFQGQRGIADGHDICVHTWSHRYMTSFESEQAFAELYYTMKAIKIVMGVTPRCWRPPFGDVDDRIRAIAAGLGLRTVMWSADTDDWNIQPYGQQSEAQIESNYQKIFDAAGSSSPIVLTHEINKLTMDEFEKMYSRIANAYKNVVPLTACHGATNPYPEDITYPNYADFTAGSIGAKNLPDLSTIKVDPSATLSPVALSKQTGSGTYNSPLSNKQNNKGGSTGSGTSKGGSSDSASSGAVPRVSRSALGACAIALGIAAL